MLTVAKIYHCPIGTSNLKFFMSMDIKEAKSILIIPRQTVSRALWLSCSALNRALSDNKKSVHIYVNSDIKEFAKNFIDSKTPFFEGEKLTEFSITVSGIRQEIGAVNWERQGDNLIIKIETDESEGLQPKIKLNNPKPEFDLRIFLGISRKLAEQEKKFTDQGLTNGTAIFFDDDDYIQRIYDLITTLKKKPSRLVLDELLTALKAYTDNFTLNISPEIFELASTLVRKGAEYLKSEKPEEFLYGGNTEQNEADESENTKKHNEPDPIKKKELKKDKNEQNDDIQKEAVEPEEAPPNYDPLAPAISIPQPLQINNSGEKPVDNSPLPSA